MSRQAAEINTSNPFCRLLSRADESSGGMSHALQRDPVLVALTVTEAQPSPRSHRAPWDGLGQVIPARKGNACEVPEASWDLTRVDLGPGDTRMQWRAPHPCADRGKPHHKAAPGKPKLKLIGSPHLKPLSTLRPPAGAALALGHHSKQSQLSHTSDLEHLIFTQLSQAIFKPSYLQAGYWCKTH